MKCLFPESNVFLNLIFHFTVSNSEANLEVVALNMLLPFLNASREENFPVYSSFLNFSFKRPGSMVWSSNCQVATQL